MSDRTRPLPRQSSNLAAKPDCPSCNGTGWATVFAGNITVAGGVCRCIGGTVWAPKVKEG